MTTMDGDELSLTDRHYIPVFDAEENRVKIIRTSRVTLEHRLIMFNRSMSIEKIVIGSRRGFFSPLTLSGYLMVNNISASVFSERSVDFRSSEQDDCLLSLICSYQVSQQSFQHIFLPVRVYYQVMRWCLGDGYDPFATEVKEGLHPVVSFYKRYASEIRVITMVVDEILPSIVMMMGLFYVGKLIDDAKKKL